MLKRLFLALAAFTALSAAALAPPAAAAAAPEPAHRVEIGQMMGRWYEVARIPNKLQNGCVAATSDWTRNAEGFAVVQACRKGKDLSQWKAQARVADPATNAKLKMSFFGGLVSQDYVVLDHRPEQGWLILATANGKYLWLMSHQPALPTPIRAQALARIRQLGFDVGRLEFPAARGG